MEKLPHLSISQILASFFNAEFAQPVFVFFNKLQHPVGIGFRVVSQSPADGLIDEKLGLVKIINQDLFQQLDICFFFLKQLLFNGKAPQPKIFIPAPLQHKFLCLRIMQTNIAYRATQKVNCVPPRFCLR